MPRDTASLIVMNDTIKTILSRRSVSKLSHPAPSSKELKMILKAASSAPDHGSLRPFRFIVFEGEQKLRFAKVLMEALRNRAESKGSNLTEGQLKKENAKFERAPTVVAVAAKIDVYSKIPEIEQLLSAAAAVENLILAAKSLNYDSMWRTGEATYDSYIKKAIRLEENDHIVAWVYLGTDSSGNDEPRDPSVTDLVTFWEDNT